MRITLVVALLSMTAQAQLARDRVENAQDRKALRHDGRATRDDRRDLRVSQVLLGEFDAARTKNDVVALRALDQRFADALKREQRETRVELKKDRREVREDRGELATDPPGKGKADDRRDLAVDTGDAQAEVRQAQRIAAMRTEWQALTGRVDPAGLDLKRGLLVEYVGLSTVELVRDGKEAREDVKELREDRRETVKDARSR